ncbi:MAG TPA: hypothetical protein VII63_03965 [Caulobacteraceae bacterium]
MKVLIPIVSSLFVGAYAGFIRAGFLASLGGALILGAIGLFENRDLLKRSRDEHFGAGARFTVAQIPGVALIYLALALIALALEGITYWLAALLHPISN